MTIRPVFWIDDKNDVRKTDIEFKWNPGMNIEVYRRNIHSLHSSFLHEFPKYRLLEISTKSETQLGREASAFNLKYKANNRKYFIECIFQGSKVFGNKGPYQELYIAEPIDAKKDERLKNKTVTKFLFFKDEWTAEPYTAFYSWLYINAIIQNQNIAEQISNYNAFTDIAFNPKKSINCQAFTAALYASWRKNELLEGIMKSKEIFIKEYIKTEKMIRNNNAIQGNLF